MKSIRNVEGSEQSSQPLIYGTDTVYVHTNIRQETRTDEATGTQRDIWVYDEEQYTYAEWQIKETEQIKADMLYISIMTGVEL